MNIMGMMFIAAGSCFAMCWLLNYVPLIATIVGLTFSPRLLVCKILSPFDSVMTIILVMGSWIGIGSAVMGINTIIYNVLTGIGISMGVLFVKKVLKPRWQKQYLKLKDQRELTLIPAK